LPQPYSSRSPRNGPSGVRTNAIAAEHPLNPHIADRPALRAGLQGIASGDSKNLLDGRLVFPLRRRA